MADGVIYVTVTDYTFVQPGPTRIATSEVPLVSGVISSNVPLTTISKSSTAIEVPVPTSTSTGSSSLERSDNALVFIILVCIILSSLIYILLICLACFQNRQGHCPNCKAVEAKLRRLEEGMASDARALPRKSMGSAERHRQAALNNLEGTYQENLTIAGPSYESMLDSAWPTYDNHNDGVKPEGEAGNGVTLPPPVYVLSQMHYQTPRPVSFNNKPRIFAEKSTKMPSVEQHKQAYRPRKETFNPYGYGWNYNGSTSESRPTSRYR